MTISSTGTPTPDDNTLNWVVRITETCARSNQLQTYASTNNFTDRPPTVRPCYWQKNRPPTVRSPVRLPTLGIEIIGEALLNSWWIKPASCSLDVFIRRSLLDDKGSRKAAATARMKLIWILTGGCKEHADRKSVVAVWARIARESCCVDRMSPFISRTLNIWTRVDETKNTYAPIQIVDQNATSSQ